MLTDKDPRHFRIVWQYYAGKAAAWILCLTFILDFIDEVVLLEHYGVSWRDLVPWLVTLPVYLLCVFVIKYTRDYTTTFFDVDKS
jgi:hypothetical protein